ncbi:hypothetical protein GCM10023340_16600 [Nocardioides marinquilinus]|uniref:Bacterial Ig-like domain-containing protein n=1 Tax=Nocardioides marinquilinus TaxID=1210400 RepID=A0ABP9PML5_9ACTN
MPVVRRLSALVAAAVGASVLSLVPGAPASGATVTAERTTSTPSAPAPAPASSQPRRGTPHDPATYYAGTEGLTGADLAARLNTIIKGHTRLSYTPGVWDALKVLDRDPNNSSAIIDFYSGVSMPASNQCGSASNCWNREHTWAQSHGDLTTSAGPGTDLHHMRPSFMRSNSARGNLDFDDSPTGSSVPDCAVCKRDSDSFEPPDAVKGDLARGLFYMAVRYEGDAQFSRDLKLNDRTCNGSGAGNHGKLSTLIRWSQMDPPDDRERLRNNLIDADYQGNRNPFIDHPEWVASIFGDGVGRGPACGSTTGTEYSPGGTTPPTNNPPTTSAVTVSTAEDTAISVTLTATDPDGDPLTWSISQTAINGSAGISGATLSYTPSPNWSGTDVVGVRVSDGRGGVATTTVTITVTPVNDPPVASDLTVSTPRGTAARIVLNATDVDDTDLGYTVVSGPAHGTAALADGAVTYTPSAGYTGSDSFTYRARDPQGALSNLATVSITVTAPVQHPPVPSDVNVSTDEDTAISFTLPATDADGDPLSFDWVSYPANGTLGLNAPNNATYTPRHNFHGTDSFTWSVSDGTSTVTATATITVRSVNDPPVAYSRSASTDEDTPVMVFLVGEDPDGGPITFAITHQAAHGTVTLLNDNVATYTPAANFHGADSFTFTVSDGEATDTGTIDLTVRPVNDAPTAADVNGTRTDEVAETGTGGVTIPLAGEDVDGDVISYALADGPDHGEVTVAGAAATYTPSPFFHGTDSFTYTASDGLLTSAPATVTVTVDHVNHAPVITGPTLALATEAGTPVTATITATDPDAGDVVTITDVSEPTHGSVSVSGSDVTYTPQSREGTDSFLVTVGDGHGGTASALLTVAVSARTAQLTVTTPRAVRGTRVTTTVTMAPAGRAGEVVLRSGATVLGRADLAPDGTARVSWVPGRAGTTSLTASWAGDSLYGPATEPASVAVQKSAARLRLAADGPLRRGKPGVVTVTVAKVAGSPATGTVTLKVGSKNLTAKLARGVARFRIAKLPTTASTRLTARYAGDTQYAAATTTRTFTLRR